MSEAYDLIVIGGGSGGHAAANKAAASLSKVALVESAGALGGLCILRGCMPSKTLIETANVMRTVRHASDFAVKVTCPPQLDHVALEDRLKTLIGGFQSYREEAMQEAPYELVRGTATFAEKGVIEVESEGAQTRSFTAKKYIIATGSEIIIPDIEGLAETPYWTSDEVTTLTKIPRTLAIIGAGAIGMECAHLYEGLGSQVSVFARSRVLSSFDEDLSVALKMESEDRGIKIYEGSETQRASYDEGAQRFTLVFEDAAGEEREETYDALLIATGRAPRVTSLNLEAVGVDYCKKGIKVDAYCQSSDETIYAVGDCAATLPLVHLAVYQGERVGAELETPREEKTSLEHLSSTEAFYGVFTEPEVVKVGLSKKEAQENGYEIAERSYPFSEQGKGEIKQSKHGFAKLLIDQKTHRILGAAAVGPNVIDLAHIMQVAIAQEMTAEAFLDVPYYHPTLAEIWSYIVEDFLAAQT